MPLRGRVVGLKLLDNNDHHCCCLRGQLLLPRRHHPVRIKLLEDCHSGGGNHLLLSDRIDLSRFFVYNRRYNAGHSQVFLHGRQCSIQWRVHLPFDDQRLDEWMRRFGSQRRHSIGNAVMSNTLRTFYAAFGLLSCVLSANAQNGTTPSCTYVPASKTCMDATPCKTDSAGNTACLSGVVGPSGSWSVAQTCWQYSYRFACAGATLDTCTAYENNNACSLLKSVCSDTVPSNGTCAQYDYTYSCITQAAQSSKVMSCTSGLFNSSALAKPTTQTSTFQKAAIATEIANQASTYNTGGNNLFAGVPEQCKKGWGGLKDCCKTTGGAKSNSEVINLIVGAGASTVKYAAEKAVDLASPFVFDAMYSSSQYTAGMMTSMAAANTANIAANSEGIAVGTTFAANGLSLGAYGFTYGTGSFDVYSSTSMIKGNIDISNALGMGDGSSGFVSFNPYVFAAMVVVQILQDLASCEQGEQMLSMHKGANLSVFVSGSCSATIPILGTCIEWTDRYCSFNSVLSKIVNTQGKPQLGLAVSDCKGLTQEQLGKIDFTRIDFSEYATAQASQAQSHLPTNIKGNYTPILQSASKGSAQSTSPVLPSYKGP